MEVRRLKSGEATWMRSAALSEQEQVTSRHIILSTEIEFDGAPVQLRSTSACRAPERDHSRRRASPPRPPDVHTRLPSAVMAVTGPPCAVFSATPDSTARPAGAHVGQLRAAAVGLPQRSTATACASLAAIAHCCSFDRVCAAESFASASRIHSSCSALRPERCVSVRTIGLNQQRVRRLQHRSAAAHSETQPHSDHVAGLRADVGVAATVCRDHPAPCRAHGSEDNNGVALHPEQLDTLSAWDSAAGCRHERLQARLEASMAAEIRRPGWR